MPRFTGFPPATFGYLSALRENNRRSWFEAKRTRYEASWMAPALDFIEAL